MNHSLYLHIPFCRHRCAYCDFNTYAGKEALIPAYVQALVREIRSVAESVAERLPVHTVFFGGGTPSLLSPAEFQSILETIRRHFALIDAEVTIEANPGTVSFDRLNALHAQGINRISFGVQSANPEELRMLEREHDYFDVVRAVTWARRAGFSNLNLDLIYGLPLQSLERWQATVKLILGLHPEHISAYALTLEHGTPFGRWAKRGLMPLPDPDAAADMYEWAAQALAEAGYQQYEISNWAQPGRQCRHNLQYWRSLPYLGLGAGAHSYAAGIRYSNVLRIQTYIDRLATASTPPAEFPRTPATVNYKRNSLQDEMGETMLTGLRLTQEGVSDAQFTARFGQSLETAYGREVRELSGLGLLEWREKRPAGSEGLDRSLVLTERARLLSNQVFIRFLSDPT